MIPSTAANVDYDGQVLIVGKYSGYEYKAILQRDPGYCDWVHSLSLVLVSVVV